MVLPVNASSILKELLLSTKTAYKDGANESMSAGQDQRAPYLSFHSALAPPLETMGMEGREITS